MGVKGLWKAIAPVKRDVTIESLRGKVLAVDLAIWVVQAETVTDNQYEGIYLRQMFFKINHLLEHGIGIVIVTDGRAPHLKAITIARRLGVELDRNNKVIQRRRFMTIMKECEALATSLGITVLKGEFEAEAAAARLQCDGLVDGVITCDGDAFLYGARQVYRNLLVTEKTCEEYCMSLVETQIGLSRDDLVGMSILNGCDYNPDGIPGLGRKTVMDYILSRDRTRNVTDELLSWNNQLEDIGSKHERLKGIKAAPHCGTCKHPGSKKQHNTKGCTLCETTRACTVGSAVLCTCTKHAAQRLLSSPHMQCCVKFVSKSRSMKGGIAVKEIIEEFANNKRNAKTKPCWSLPPPSNFISFMHDRMRWKKDVLAGKFAHIAALHAISKRISYSRPHPVEGQEILEFSHILKTRKKEGLDLLELEFSVKDQGLKNALEFDTVYVILETGFVESLLPEAVREFNSRETQLSRKKKGDVPIYDKYPPTKPSPPPPTTKTKPKSRSKKKKDEDLTEDMDLLRISDREPIRDIPASLVQDVSDSDVVSITSDQLPRVPIVHAVLGSSESSDDEYVPLSQRLAARRAKSARSRAADIESVSSACSDVPQPVPVGSSNTVGYPNTGGSPPGSSSTTSSDETISVSGSIHQIHGAIPLPVDTVDGDNTSSSGEMETSQIHEIPQKYDEAASVDSETFSSDTVDLDVIHLDKPDNRNIPLSDNSRDTNDSLGDGFIDSEVNLLAETFIDEYLDLSRDDILEISHHQEKSEIVSNNVPWDRVETTEKESVPDPSLPEGSPPKEETFVVDEKLANLVRDRDYNQLFFATPIQSTQVLPLIPRLHAGIAGDSTGNHRSNSTGNNPVDVSLDILPVSQPEDLTAATIVKSNSEEFDSFSTSNLNLTKAEFDSFSTSRLKLTKEEFDSFSTSNLNLAKEEFDSFSTSNLNLTTGLDVNVSQAIPDPQLPILDADVNHIESRYKSMVSEGLLSRDVSLISGGFSPKTPGLGLALSPSAPPGYHSNPSRVTPGYNSNPSRVTPLRDGRKLPDIERSSDREEVDFREIDNGTTRQLDSVVAIEADESVGFDEEAPFRDSQTRDIRDSPIASLERELGDVQDGDIRDVSVADSLCDSFNDLSLGFSPLQPITPHTLPKEDEDSAGDGSQEAPILVEDTPLANYKHRVQRSREEDNNSSIMIVDPSQPLSSISTSQTRPHPAPDFPSSPLSPVPSSTLSPVPSI